MSFNVKGAVQLPLDLFGGLVTEMPAANLPAGVSPDCPDCVFRPGAVGSRPALTKIFATAFGNVTLTYAKSYVDNSGVIRNLYLDSAGNLWVENITVSPGTFTLLGTTTPGSYAKSITAFGREYIAVSDGLRGQEVPLQYDGTFLDRVTQDGPGGAPAISNVILPAVSMAATGAPAVLTITQADPLINGDGTITNFQVRVTSLGVLQVGNRITIAGNSTAAFNGTWDVEAIVATSNLFFVGATMPSGTVSGVGGTVTIGSGTTMVRAGNIVTVTTAVAHQLRIGFQAQITGIPGFVVGTGVTSIVINNEDNPGLATVTTSTAHGLVPGVTITLDGVSPVTVGGASPSFSRQGGFVTVTTASNHGLAIGSVVTIVGTTSVTLNGSFVVSIIRSPTVFVYAQVDTDLVENASPGFVQLTWPLPTTASPPNFQVVASPSPTTFQIAFAYGNSTFTTGTVTFPWDGTFFVSAVPNSTTFQYNQIGPDATTATVGTVTPQGQATPGNHQMQVLFLTRQDAITAPSPPVKFVANGGQYLSIVNIPIGPPNIKARILAFTGADGAYFFYIPVAAQINSQVVSTATQINDNTTTTVMLDFSDQTLFRSLGISVPGNQLANQIVLDSALGFAFFAQRLISYGQRNRIQNFQNLGFDGGFFPSTPTVPTGWFVEPVSGLAGGALVPGHYGQGWQFGGTGNIHQTAYLDAYGAPILLPNTAYRLRAWIQGVGATATLMIQAYAVPFTSVATITGTSATGSWVEAAFSLKTPLTIGQDTVLILTGTGGGIIDEISILYAAQPDLNTIFHASYVNNPEGFDGVSGIFGSNDTRKIMTAGVIRQTLCHLTQDPAGRLHTTLNNPSTEPAGWTTNEVAGNCGALSAFCMTISQADDATAGGGEEWIAWASVTGARIFGGDQPWKISQEIQPDWDGINTGAFLTVWALNDPSVRRIYFGLPKGFLSDGVTLATAPNKIYHVDYKELDGAYGIAEGAPVHLTFTGKLVARDHARKWSPWNVTANGASMIYRIAGGPLYTVFYVGNGAFPGTVAGGCGNVFALCTQKQTDDCLGQLRPYYITYGFTSAELEQAFQLGGQRHLLYYLQWYALGNGRLKVTPFVDTLSNPWPITATLPLRADPTYDDEWGAGMTAGQRIFLKFEALPS